MNFELNDCHDVQRQLKECNFSLQCRNKGERKREKWRSAEDEKKISELESKKSKSIKLLENVPPCQRT